MAGMFITLEGGEGLGKSTQAKRLALHFEAQGKTVVQTREPGGTAAAEALRALLVQGDTDRWSSTAEALLNYAARDSHLRTVIRPALAAGHVVICDRFMDSTRAYQAMAGDCPLALIESLEQSVVGPTRPDLTLVFDADAALGLQRAKLRAGNGEDRFERKGLAYHSRLRDAFRSIATANPKRCMLIAADQTIEAVWHDVKTAVERLQHG